MENLICGLVCVLLVVLFVVVFAMVIATLVQHTRKMKELCEYGLEATAIIERNYLRVEFKIAGIIRTRSQPADRRREITYRYTDNTGATHTGYYNATASLTQELASLAVGATFPIIYSSKRPTESAPKYLVDQFRQAFKKRL